MSGDQKGVPTVNPSDWIMDWGEQGVWPFVEDENANITGLDHQDPAEFAAAINRYDEACGADPIDPEDQWSADHISHQWALLSDDGERLIRAHADSPGAIAITTLWGQR